MKRLHPKAVCTMTLGLFLSTAVFAKEGMWQPSQFKRQESDMQKLGMKIPVELLYSETGSALNNAVVLFGKGCTGEMVSGNGLLFTNHHCGYSYAQSLSSDANNYLINGFWAGSPKEELPCPGLTVSYVRKIENVTDYILNGIKDDTPEADRTAHIQKRIAELQKAYKNIQGLDAEIKPYYNGNQYWASLIETFSDVRLVAFPPNGIGKFGGDTDNWMWPRTTGDFAVFRVYASKDNKPAAYNMGNVPYKPKAFFSISTSGYKEGDFAMTYGFPAQTQQYITSYQLNQVQYITDPIRIEAREKKLGVWDEAMRTNPDVFLKYAAKQSTLSNGYKKWQGEILGLNNYNVINRKQDFERSFQARVSANDTNKEDQMLIPRIQAVINGNDDNLITSEYTKETVMGIEVIQQSSWLQKVMNLYRSNITGAALSDSLQKIKSSMAGFYKNYDLPTDHKVFDVLMPLYMQQNNTVVAPKMKGVMYNSGNNFTSWGNNVFSHSIATSQDAMNELLDNGNKADSVKILQDPAYQIYDAVSSYNRTVIDPALTASNKRLEPLNRMYLRRQMEMMNTGINYYPDANQTLRLSYGKIQSVKIPGSDIYQTTLDDVMPRNNPAVEEFNVPQGLQDLYKAKDYGRWGVNGVMPVNFIASNHTSGGNSGSPILNDKGQLIGINFDRIWQGTMSDLYYNGAICRNVGVDIRYVLFIIDKFGKSSWMLKEMKLVK